MVNNQQYIQDDEIDLRELWNILEKYKSYIFIFTGVIIFITLMWLSMQKPMYKAIGLVGIGSYKDIEYHTNDDTKIENIILLDNNIQLSKKLNILYIDISKNTNNKNYKIKSIKAIKNTKNLIEIDTLATSNEIAKTKLNEIISYIKNKHQIVLNDIKQQREFKIKNISKDIKNIKNNTVKLYKNRIAEQNDILNKYKKTLENTASTIKKINDDNYILKSIKLTQEQNLIDNINTIQTNIFNIKLQYQKLFTSTLSDKLEMRNTLQSLLLPYNYQNSKIIGKIITNDYPVEPNAKFILIVAGITGLILSIFLVFIINFIKNEKETNV